MIRLPPLNSLRAFEAAARLRSFKLAAEELCVTQGAISRHVAKLEDHLRVPLFVRLHRRVQPTPEGLAYLRDVQDAFGRIAGGTSTLVETSDRTTLTIKAPPTTAIWWLVPRLGRFLAKHPDFQVQLLTSHIPVDFAREEVDVALQYGEADQDGLVIDRLFGEILVPICSPRFLSDHAPLSRPEEVAARVLLHSIRRPTDWTNWFEAMGIGDRGAARTIVLENSALTYRGAIDGIGIALAQLAFIVDELATGRIMVPIDARVRNDTGYYLVFPQHKERLGRVQAFRDWVANEAAILRAAEPGL